MGTRRRVPQPSPRNKMLKTAFKSHFYSDFWATVCKMVHPMLSVRCLSVCPVCNVRALWPNGWTDQDETWQAGGPRPWPHCVRWGPSSPSLNGTQPPIFRPYLLCGQMAAWIKMSLGMELGLGPDHFMSDGDPAPCLQKGAPKKFFGPSLSWPNGWMDEAGTWHRGRPQPWRLLDGDTAPSPKRGRSPIPNFRPMFTVAKRLDSSRPHLA